MTNDSVRGLLMDAASRAASYIEQLSVRKVGAERRAVERLSEALDRPLADGPGRAADILAFLDEYGSPATVASAGGRYFGFVTGGHSRSRSRLSTSQLLGIRTASASSAHPQWPAWKPRRCGG
jgi:hypothetical protein